MKQKAKVYKGKRIVMGDKNLVTKNEIHVNDIPQEGGESDGGGNTPIKNQEKYVEITENGTTTVTPDEGFTALGKVSVNVNVPTSGEGGSASSWRYFDYSKCSIEQLDAFFVIGMMIKFTKNGEIGICGAAGIQLNSDIMLAFAVDASQYIMQRGKKMLISDFISMFEQELGKLPEISEEEFYNLEA